MLQHKIISFILLIFTISIPAWSIDMSHIRFNNEASDTSRIDRILTDIVSAHLTGNKAVEKIARQFIGTPYQAGLLDADPSHEQLTVNLDQFDCMTFAETVMALAITANERRTSWRDFIYNLQQLRYRSGIIDGYASRLHYISEWIVDNTHRGNFREITNTLPNTNYVIKTIDFMSSNIDSYPALADSATLAGVKNAEIGYRNHRFPMIKRERIGSKATMSQLRSGDILCLTTRTKGLDVAHIGILIIDNDVPMLLHASSASGQVVIDRHPLPEYLRRSKTLTGARIIRIPE